MTVLIITHSQDNQSIPLVVKAIEEKGGKAFRFDTDRFPTEVQLDVYYGKNRDGKNTERLILKSEEEKLDLQEVSAVWYRRIAMGARIPSTMDPQMRQASVQESRVTIQGMIASIDGFHLDRVPVVEQAKNKQLQLKVARELGIDTPLNLTTNNPAAVVEFAKECESGIITKMLSSFAIYDQQGQEQVVFTNPVKPEDLDNLDGLRFCPMTFQEHLPKALELRTKIVGKQVFTASIDSQQFPGARYDWRRRGVDSLNAWQPYQLPQDLEEKLLKLMDYFGLNYGAIDIILTPDGRHVFLEVNPVGEFFWLELCPGLPISQAIADVLLNLVPRRY
ncbi:MAG: MvdD family ATP-grasp ribosomal peptide maturase [Moorea sp. SIO3B2]|uniref:RimK-like ATP-grasp domain protein n=2 Tax=Moorena TaxID=1155738 RepID=F4XSH4_9CYAN|nr:RimK-like ATP-grasp domain protein [Moorena producens 3L]NEP36736.1 MvdD family ATP-grasp ribosomal peptide maturase [Moorena sp. SIO3B2]NEP70067.1 MvdD family ATP-grasp ribosomal peptide maturase [Moorena sp. SIO3A5]NEQ09309.1 MvdD family ATP-grasp ribosomal peptide maturase [Moorena sp. SIO4E2]NER92064.1 MvdD family ATP-grasp ribosomal peptide maturase [Moorena sp. SIO3A2]NES44458.1 MvdD family ATP-grasp ribosomal peptide maturase [Moorena sp. SIO2C4]